MHQHAQHDITDVVARRVVDHRKRVDSGRVDVHVCCRHDGGGYIHVDVGGHDDGCADHDRGAHHRRADNSGTGDRRAHHCAAATRDNGCATSAGDDGRAGNDRAARDRTLQR